MITGELKSQVDKIWEAFWTGGISNPLSVIEQFTYLLFVRRLDERQLLEENKANTTGNPLQNVIYTPSQKELRWSSFKNKDPESMFEVFTKPLVEGMTVFDHMKQVGDSAGVFAEFMSKATFIIVTPRLLDQVVQHDIANKVILPYIYLSNGWTNLSISIQKNTFTTNSSSKISS